LVRLPFANEVLSNYSKTVDIDFSVNPDLEDLSPLQVMDKLIAYAGVIGLQVSYTSNGKYDE
jgi:endoglucanase